MASSGPSVQSAAGSRSFDFGFDDVLCSLEDYTLQLVPAANEKCSDSSTKDTKQRFSMDLHENRVRSPSSNLYGEPDEFSREDVIYVVEKCMKKFADNLTMHLEGISGRLTQLELHYYKLERSIGEFHTDMIRDQTEADSKLKSLDKHVHEVHRAVQIIRDKQELSETQKELNKLHFLQKDSTNLIHSIKNSDDLNAATSDKANFESNDVPNQQLALAIPYQMSSPPLIAIIPDKNQPEKELPIQQSLPVSLSVLPREHYVLNQANTYYYTHHPPPLMEQHSQNLQPELQNAQRAAEMHAFSVQAPPKQEQNVAANQLTHQQTFPQYQQHWSQPMQPQQPSSQAQSLRLQTPHVYASHAPNQHANKISDSHQGSNILLPVPYPPTTLHSSGYGSLNYSFSHLPAKYNMQQQQLLQASQGSFAPQPLLAKRNYVGAGTYPSQSNMLGSNAVYVIDGNSGSNLQSRHLGSYPPNGNVAVSLIPSNHLYGDMIEKAVSIGYPRDQMVGVVVGTAESS